MGVGVTGAWHGHFKFAFWGIAASFLGESVYLTLLLPIQQEPPWQTGLYWRWGEGGGPTSHKIFVVFINDS